MDDQLGQELLRDVANAAQEVQSQIKSEVARNYLLRFAGPAVVLALLYFNRKGR